MKVGIKGERVLHIEPEGKGYEVTTDTSSVYAFDYLIGADGIDLMVTFFCMLSRPKIMRKMAMSS